MNNNQKSVLIKKYENRRLYNVNEKKYISIEDVRNLIIEGYDVVVVEKKTGKDITRQVLLQAILDMSPERIDAFPVVFLKFLIKSPSPMLNDYFRNFFVNQLEMYLGNREKYLEGLNNIQKTMFPNSKPGFFNNPFTSFFNNPFMKKNNNSEENIDSNLNEDEELPPEDINNDENEDELDELKKMMKHMADKISNLESKKRK
ncbi:MAG: polyhydroxyalkanoate synthesis regulator DNA-binding domain-containing protein [Candidatus Muiribacteriota bacterium]